MQEEDSAQPAGTVRQEGSARGTIHAQPRRTTHRGGVGEILGVPGSPGVFLSPGHVRELALLPGTTLHRLLTDPADGRLVERTITAYRPDAAMRRQVLAADVTSRNPGSRQAGSTCELDHVTPWKPDDAGGPTSEINLQAAGKRPHDQKTKGLLRVAINHRRDTTWTTVLGHAYPTRVHDYRQYLDAAVARAAQARAAERARTGDPDLTLLEDQLPGWDEHRDLANRVIYAALAERGPDACLEDDDDLPGATEHGGTLGSWLYLTNTSAAGATRSGPPTDHPTPAELLHLPTETGAETGDEPSDEPVDESGEATPWRRHDEPPPF